MKFQILTFLFLSSVLAQINDNWIETGTMNYHRFKHTATLLQDGRVLVTGGISLDVDTLAYKSTEIYNPNTGEWIVAAKMNIARFAHSAVLLENGKVLVSGGATEWSSTNTSELFDPTLNTWILIDSLKHKREDHFMVKLNDGRVLVSGGGYFDFVSGGSYSSCEIYDPVINKWNEVATMNNGMLGHSGVKLKDGNVFVIGEGFWSMSGIHYEKYDVQNNNWIVISASNFRHGSKPSLSLLDNGEVLVVGDTTICELFDPSNNSWEIANSLNYDNNSFNSIRLNGGYVLVTSSSENCELYNPNNNSFILGAKKQSKYFFYTITKLNDGKILFAGGSDSSGYSNKSYLYIPDPTLTSLGNIKRNIPTKFILYQNYPNPFNPSTTINYSINVETFVRLNVFDVLGREVARLVNQPQKPDNYTVQFDGSDLSSGVYYYQLKFGEYIQTKNMILLK